MRKPILGSLALCAALLGASSAVAGPDVPHRFAPWSLDRGLVSLENPVNGRTVAVWSYRLAGQYDLAITFREPGSTVWSEPVLIGASDSLQQEQPSVAVDSAGNLYLAYAVRETGEILLTTLRPGTDTWSAPAAVTTSPGRRSRPLVRVVADRLVVAFRTGVGLDLVELPLLAPAPIGGAGANDGPDTLPGGRTQPPPPGGDVGPWGRNR